VRNFVRRKRERGTPDVLPRGGGARALLYTFVGKMLVKDRDVLAGGQGAHARGARKRH
jgi:hypothetical protein